MKSIYLLALMSVALQLRAQTPQTPDDVHGLAVQDADVSYASLYVFTNGAGRVVPFHDGQMLEVGRQYVMVAIPERGFVFTNWMPVNVFTFTEYVSDASGAVITNSLTVVSPVPEFTCDPVLKFTMQPGEVILDVPGVRTITVSGGWQANFVMGRRWHHERGRSQTRNLN